MRILSKDVPFASIVLVAVVMLVIGTFTSAVAAIAASFIGPVTIPAWGVRVILDMGLLALILWRVSAWDDRRRTGKED